MQREELEGAGRQHRPGADDRGDRRRRAGARARRRVAAAIRRRPLGGDRPLIIESLVEDKSAYYGVPYAAIRSERFLYVEYENGEEELYDLEHDPFELESRHDDPEFAATKDALAAALESRRECAGEACDEPLEQAPDPG